MVFQEYTKLAYYTAVMLTQLLAYVFYENSIAFFSDKIAEVTLFLTVFTTNYLLHVGIHGQGAMWHNILFALHALTFWFTIKWHQQFKIKYIIACAVTIGLAVLSRPTEILIVLIPMFYQVYLIESLKQKIKLFVLYKNQMVLFIFIFCVMVSYQLVYWKIITGHFIFDSYSSNPGEGLNLKHPYLL